MRYSLIYDTETTGKAIKDKRGGFDPEDPNQPRLVQLAAALFDETGKMHQAVKLCVKPVGFTIPEEATGIHGITTDYAIEFGMPLQEVMYLFADLGRVCDETVAFNAQYDELIMLREALAFGYPDPFGAKPRLCAMLGCKDILKLPGRYGDYKFPSLQEAHCFFYGAEFEGAHDAFDDLRATAKVHLAIERWHQLQADITADETK